MATATLNVQEQGQLVTVGSQNWIVNEIEPSTLPTNGLKGLSENQTLLRSHSIEGDGLGKELQVIWELKPGAKVIERVALPEPTDFDSPEKLDASLDAVRWGAASSADLKNIQPPFRSGIEIEDYQLVPVVRAIQMPRVNWLISDDVGLAKSTKDYAEDLEYDEATTNAVDTATRLFAAPTADKKALLQKMKDWAKRAKVQRNSKAEHLVAWLKEHLKPGGKWNNQRVIIFTEYRAPQNALEEVLSARGFTASDKLITMYGGIDSEMREEVNTAFQTSPEVSPVRTLFATDAASGGLDLQYFYSKLIHFAIPWNPNWMEQRNGRVDRHGKKAEVVLVYHFVDGNYRKRATRELVCTVSDMDADLEFMMRVALKIETRLNVGQKEAGTAGAVIEEPSEAVKAKLPVLYPSLVSSFASAIDVRMRQMVDGLQEKLGEREVKEVNDITSILRELKRSIEADLKDPVYVLPMLIATEEQERFERNKDAMQARANNIPEEIKRETEAIRARFANPQARRFPVAVTFLVHEKMAEV
ncbi:MAG: DEAD/DEAH box helicase [Planctomycetes bacterium]|nr:DEAD/DEAH box helicase [Planctomycetota bacterium]